MFYFSSTSSVHSSPSHPSNFYPSYFLGQGDIVIVNYPTKKIACFKVFKIISRDGGHKQKDILFAV